LKDIKRREDRVPKENLRKWKLEKCRAADHYDVGCPKTGYVVGGSPGRFGPVNNCYLREKVYFLSDAKKTQAYHAFFSI
jgi:hypothetical protein